MPSSATYRQRFGSLLRACELAGYVPRHKYHFVPQLRRFPSIVAEIRESIIRNIELSGCIARFDQETNLLWINEEFAASIQPVYCNNYLRQTPRWRIRLTASPRADMIIGVRMNESNTDVLDYYLLPRIDLSGTFLWLRQKNRAEIDAYRCDTLAPLFKLCARREIDNEAGRIAAS